MAFERDELHTAIFTIDDDAELIRVYAVVRAYFDEGFAIRLEDED